MATKTKVCREPSVSLDPGLHLELKLKAVRERTSMQALAEEAIKAYLSGQQDVTSSGRKAVAAR